MALKSKRTGKSSNDINEELVEDLDALVDSRTGKESKSINDGLITQREYDKRRHKEHR